MTTQSTTTHTATDTATVAPVTGGHTATCTCGWVAFGGAILTLAGAERAASIHTR